MTARIRIKLLGLLALAVLGAGIVGLLIGEEPPPLPKPVAVQLDWLHGSDFAGFYAADQKGTYAAEGLAVSFLTGGPSEDPVSSVVDGRAQLATATAHHLLLARARGEPVPAIACIFRRSPLAFAALAGSGITRPGDFQGKVIRVGKQQVPVLEAMLRRAGVSDPDLTLVQTRDLERFTSGEIQVWGGYITSSLRRVGKAGYDLNFVYPDDYGVHAYQECLFTTDGLIAAESDLIQRFLRATLAGWRYAVDHPVEVGSMVAKYLASADTEDEIEHLRAARPLFNTGEDHIGWMKPEVWADMTDNLGRLGLLANPVDPSEVYTLRFLEEIYGAGK